ncbi:sigma-70 family RNA polymerase sigma factor [endosymbiont GvMRE of Glomus versiforme]|uniref:sigma-70 family RNA polymerase sigma factor n=1 Tax=endosymbiont GvMRE of Glomus versiforme TaxID=2039283 RepID=UPI000EEDA1C0|nr:sigma-70 family RNA polymerase sigma factor [endosymbiont GvMRE of Glomus versiforme]RHZ35698.1 RNA polymerase sigma factor [endosymbiont GvMRE of Glomus versiforme]
MNKITTLKPEKEKELLKIAKEGNEEEKKNAIRQLIFHNWNLVKYIVRGRSYFRIKGSIDYEDLIAEGIKSLPKAIEKFDLNSKNLFATYGGFWIKQYIQSFVNKNQIINQGHAVKDKKRIIYYDNVHQGEEKENKSHSLAEILNDDENNSINDKQVHKKDVVVQINNLINLLNDDKEILLVRLMYRIIPNNLLDIYYMASEEEKEEIKGKMKINNPRSLQKYSLGEKRNKNLLVVKKYLKLFSRDYKFSELSELLKKPENSVRKLKQDIFKKLKENAKKKKLHFLIDDVFDLTSKEKEKWEKEKKDRTKSRKLIINN